MGRLVILVLRELELALPVLLAALLLSLSELTACFCCCYGTALLLERVRAFACAAAAASLPKLPHHAIALIRPSQKNAPHLPIRSTEPLPTDSRFEPFEAYC